MSREDMIAEISMRCDVPMEDVEDVLDEAECIELENKKRKKRRKKMCFMGAIILFMAGVASALYILDKKQKIDVEDAIKVYSEKMAKSISSMQENIQQTIKSRM